MVTDSSGCIESLSVIIPVGVRFNDLQELHADYSDALNKVGVPIEFLYVLDGDFPEARSALEIVSQLDSRVRIIQLGRHFGEATALQAGIDYSIHGFILTLPAYYQVIPESLSRIFELNVLPDVTLGCRSQRKESWLNRISAAVFNGLVRATTNTRFKDLGSGVRLVDRRVLDEIDIYGDLHRFFPILAEARGYKVVQVDLPQSDKEPYLRVPRIGVITRRMLDLLSVFFLVKFTRKPLRFFGLLGVATMVIGLLLISFVIGQKMMSGVALADRPALLLASLLIVLGLQMFGVGLIGEIVIFTHSSQLREYAVAEIISKHSPREDGQ